MVIQQPSGPHPGLQPSGRCYGHCHGKEGYGDGSKAAELETEMRELGSAEVQGQSDGELYYKSIIGRDEMPNFEKKIRSDEDRWMVINYLRELAE